MGSSAFPALDIKPVQQPDLLGQAGSVLQLKDLMNRQKLFPQQQAEATARAQSAQLDNQMKQIAVRDQSIWSDALREAGGDFTKATPLAASKGASFNSLLEHESAMADLHQKLAATSKVELENYDTQHQNLRDELQSVLALPPDQQEAEYNQRIEVMKANPAASAKAYGMDPAQIPPYKGPQDLQRQADALAGFHNLIKEHTEQQTANATTLNAKTNASREAREAEGKTPPSQADIYKENAANYRATLARSASMANDLQKNGLVQLDRMFTDPVHGYTQFLSQADATKNAVSQAKNGNELAASMVPLMTALGITSYAGIHRVNQQEIAAAGPTVGSLYRRLNTALDKAGEGKLNSETAKETIKIMDDLIDARHGSLVQGSQMIVKNAGLDPAKTFVMSKSGDPISLDKATAPKLPGADDTKDLYQMNGKYYHYKGTGSMNDMQNFQEVAPPQ